MDFGGWSTGSIITLILCISVAIICSGFVFYLLGKKSKETKQKENKKQKHIQIFYVEIEKSNEKVNIQFNKKSKWLMDNHLLLLY